MQSHVMTLANSIIGVGILAMPFCFQKCGILLSIVLLVLSNYITRICCHYLIKASLLTRRKSFEFLGFHAFGSSGKLLVELCIIGYLLGTCITYFVVVGDLGPQIISKMFALENSHTHLRTIIMLVVTLICILPLGMLKNVDSLSTVFTASIGFYICLVLKIVLESENHILANDWQEQVVYWRPAGVLQCLPIFSMALSCQMQLFEVFASVNNQSIEKLNGIVKNATWICTFVYIAVGFFGYVAFCTKNFNGNILVNLPDSFGSDVIKIGFILSVAFSFPLVIFPCRASLYSLLYRKGHGEVQGQYIPESRFKCITVFIVSLSLTIALLIPSVELIIGLVGSTIGVAICIMFPAACFRKIIKKESAEKSLAQFIIISGFCLMILGTYANLSAIDVNRSGAHLEPESEPLMPIEMPASKLPLPVIIDAEVAKLVEAKHAENSDSVLPVDENHNDNIVKLDNKLPVVPAENPVIAHKEEDKLQVISPLPDDAIKKLPLESENIKKIGAAKEVLPNATLNVVQQPAGNLLNSSAKAPSAVPSINKDAIKNDEAMIAEESMPKAASVQQPAAVQAVVNNDKDAELVKTKIQLQETKQKILELKKEFAKQTKQTENLVVEKLAQVEEKVNEIERNVQLKQASQEQPHAENVAPGLAAAAAAAVAPVNKPPENKLLTKGSLLTRLAEVAPKTANKVYEPLSYKTGELMENAAKNNNTLEQRRPLPLALLINSSQAKTNESLLATDATNAKPALALTAKANDSFAETGKSTNLVDSKQNSSSNLKVDELAARVKRDIVEQDNAEALNSKKENCIPEPKLEQLMANGLSNGIQIHALAEELKSHGDEKDIL